MYQPVYLIKIPKQQQPKEIKFRNKKLRLYTPSVSSMSLHGSSITIVFPDKKSIPHKDKKRKFMENLIAGNYSSQEPDNSNKKVKVDSIIDEK